MGYTTPLHIPPGVIVDRHIRDLVRVNNMISDFVDHTVRESNGVRITSYGLSSIGYDVRLSNHFKILNPGKHIDEFFNIQQLLGSGVVEYDALDSVDDPDFKTYVVPKDRYIQIENPDQFRLGDGINTVENLTPIYGIEDFEINPRNMLPEFFEDKIIPEGECLILGPNQSALGSTVESFQIPDDVFATVDQKSTLARCFLNVTTTVIHPGQTGQITLELTNLTDKYMKIWPGDGIAQFIFTKLTSRPDMTYAQRGGKYMGQHGPTLPV